MPAPRIFISHSTRTEEARAYLGAAEDALRKNNSFEPLLDHVGLCGGDDWKKKIFEWMDQAHGAVLLLSLEALKSHFVPIELSILSFRYCREQNFPLIPVLLDDVKPEDTQDGLIGNLGLRKIHFIQARQPEEAAEKIRHSLDNFFLSNSKPHTPRELLVEQATKYLRQAGLSEVDIEEVTESIAGWTPLRKGSRLDLHAELAKALLEKEFERACEMLRYLSERQLKADPLSGLLDLLAPFWIDETHAAPIAQRALAEVERRLFSLDVEKQETVTAFVCRSCMRPLRKGWLVCNLEPFNEEDSFASLRRQVLENLWPKNSFLKTFDPDLAMQTLVTRENEGIPVFVVLPRGWPLDRELLTRLRSELSPLTVIAITANEAIAALNPDFKRLSTPGRERELKEWGTYQRTARDLQER